MRAKEELPECPVATAVSVSYTHLDVYKRQSYIWVDKKGLHFFN